LTGSGEDHHRGDPGGGERCSGGDAVGVRESGVHQNQVRAKGGRQRDGLVAVGGLADHGEAFSGEQLS